MFYFQFCHFFPHYFHNLFSSHLDSNIDESPDLRGRCSGLNLRFFSHLPLEGARVRDSARETAEFISATRARVEGI